jgi:uncharacterized protein DUF6314
VTAGERETLHFLTGHWNVVREISDRHAQRSGRFTGTASFTPAAGAVQYAEAGELEYGDHRGPASRSLIYEGRDDGTADVFFADGRAFFRLDLRRDRCEADHPCRADLYRVTVERTGPDSFTETWQVTGPDKDYQLTTFYERISGGAALPRQSEQEGDA